MTSSSFELAADTSALLLVEGNDDARFFAAFLRHLGRNDVRILPVRGKDNFAPFLTTLPSLSNFASLRVLGVVRDADANAQSALQSLQGSLRRAGLPVPNRVFEPAQEGGLTVSMAILPDGSDAGDLEELCLRSVQDRPAMTCVDQYMGCLANAEGTTGQASKARLHAFLAAGDDPDRRIGEAADAGVWDWDSDVFRQLADFLRAL